MRSRKLRIAWSVGWGVACILFIAIAYTLQKPNPSPPPATRNSMHWEFKLSPSKTLITGTYPAEFVLGTDRRKMRTIDYVGFSRQSTWHHLLLTVPHWFPVALSMAVGYWTPAFLTFARAAIARFSWRFSLRTLLIAMTVVAALLGAVVWAVK
jgi:hypothetical protein